MLWIPSLEMTGVMPPPGPGGLELGVELGVLEGVDEAVLLSVELGV